MKKIILLFAFFISVKTYSQTGNILVNMNGIGDFKIGMKKADAEKLIGKTLTPKNMSKEDDQDMDSFNVAYKGANFSLIFAKDYVDDKHFDVTLYEVGCNNNLLQTPSGIGIGTDKIKIITTYEGYTIWIMPDWENNDYTIKSKTKSTVWLHGDDSGHVIIFHLNNNIVESISVSVEEGD